MGRVVSWQGPTLKWSICNSTVSFAENFRTVIFHKTSGQLLRKNETKKIFLILFWSNTENLELKVLINHYFLRESRSQDLRKHLRYTDIPADTDVFKTSSGRLKKVTTSYDQTRRLHDVWQKTSDLRRLEDVWFTSSNQWSLEDVWFTSSWRRPINVLKTSNLHRLEKVQFFATSWKRLIYDVFGTSDLWRLEDIRFTSSWRSLTYDVLKTSDLRRLEDVWFMTSWRRL